MAGIKHAFQSEKADSSNATKVRATNWNADHIVEDIETVDGHFSWNNTFKRILVGFAGVYDSARAVLAEMKHGGPNWETLNNIWEGFSVNINEYPANAQFGSDITPCPQAIVGKMVIPNDTPWTNHGTGVSGYAISGGINNAGVGIYGFGGVTQDIVPGAFGGNFAAHNSAVLHHAISHALRPAGFDHTNLYGVEIDLGAYKKADGSTPNSVSQRGLYLQQAGNCQPTNFKCAAIDISCTNPSLCQWKDGVFILDGAITVDGWAMNVGTVTQGNNTGSNRIKFPGRKSDGTETYTILQQDPDGNFLVRPGPNGLTSIQNHEGTTHYLNIGNGVSTFGSRVVMDAPNIPANASADGIEGEIAWDSSYIYICIAHATWKRVAIATW